MNLRLPECASLCLVWVFFVTAGCSESSPTAPAEPRTRAKITAEPRAIVPEFHSGVPCPQRFGPFDGRLALVFDSPNDFVLRGLRFEFVDAFGGRAAPRVSSAAAAAPSLESRGSTPVPIPTSPTIPFPSSPSIPFPTASDPTRIAGPFDPVPVPAGARALPLVLQFGCGVPATGILFIDVEIETGGAFDARRLEVPVRG